MKRCGLIDITKLLCFVPLCQVFNQERLGNRWNIDLLSLIVRKGMN